MKLNRPPGLSRLVMVIIAGLVIIAMLLPTMAAITQSSSSNANSNAKSTLPVTTTPAAMPMADQAQSGLNTNGKAQIDQVMEQGEASGQYPSAVVLVAHDGSIDKISAYGDAVKYDQNGKLLAQPIPATEDTMYDLASVTKLFTATSVMKLQEQGKVDLVAPVAKYLPEFAANGKDKITVRQLLTHTSGLPAGAGLWSAADTPEGREQALYRIKPIARPGQEYLYSDVNYLVLGKLVERVSGQSLDVFMSWEFFQPLGMNDTMFNPPVELRSRIAATEISPNNGRHGLVWGQVHDGEAYALGGVAGNAGLFSTARDVALFSQMLLNGGEYDGVRVLAPETVSAMLSPQSTSQDGHVMGLGWELNEQWYMGDLTHNGAAGHTGYTGTSLVISRKTNTIVVILSNAVHPYAHGAINAVRCAVSSTVERTLD